MGIEPLSELRLTLEPPVAFIVLDGPERRNAISVSMWRRLAQVTEDIETRKDIEVVIVEGAGGCFCSGADIAEFDAVFAGVEAARNYLHAIESALEKLSQIDRPTLAKVEGPAIGGGLAIALACDLRFASEEAHFAAPPAKLGLLYGPLETKLLVETIGPAAAKDMLFSGRTMGSAEALQLGLINRRFPAGALAEAVTDQAQTWAKLSGASIRGAKKAVRAVLASNVAEVRTLVETLATGEDFREGRAAFKARRPPIFARGK